MFIGLNSLLRRQRRRLAMLAVMLGLAGGVVVAHSAIEHDHIGDVMVMCLGVSETTVVAVGAALALGARMRRPLWLIAVAHEPEPAFVPSPVGVRSRAGPPGLQVFRL